LAALGTGSGAVTGAGGIGGVEATIDRAFALSAAAGRSGCGVVEASALVELARVSARDGGLAIGAFADGAGGSDTTAADSAGAIGRLAELSGGTSTGSAEGSVSSGLVDGASTGRDWLDGACATTVAGAFCHCLSPTAAANPTTKSAVTAAAILALTAEVRSGGSGGSATGTLTCPAVSWSGYSERN
jgi:hypothetical protein